MKVCEYNQDLQSVLLRLVWYVEWQWHFWAGIRICGRPHSICQ